jgi:hypothetical protein
MVCSGESGRTSTMSALSDSMSTGVKSFSGSQQIFGWMAGSVPWLAWVHSSHV